MGIILPDNVTAEVVKVGGQCYRFVEIRDADVDTGAADEEYATCEECESGLPSEAPSDTPSETSLPSETSTPSEPSLGGNNPSSLQLTYCVYSECSSISSEPSAPSEPSLGAPSVDPSTLPPTEPSEGSSTFCVYSECSASSAVSSDNSSATSSATSSAASSGVVCSENSEDCGVPGVGPAMLVTVSWDAAQEPETTLKSVFGCDFCNGETRAIWPDAYKWECEDMQDNADCNVQGGMQYWRVPGLSFSIHALAIEPGDYGPNYTAAAVMNFIAAYGGITHKASYKGIRASINAPMTIVSSTALNMTGFNVPIDAWNANPVNTGERFPNKYGWGLASPPQDDMRIGSLTDTVNNVTISWEPEPFSWQEESVNPAPICNDKLLAGVDASAPLQTCGSFTTNPTLFMTLAWVATSPETDYPIEDMYMHGSLDGHLTVQATSHSIAVGDSVKFSGTQTRQRIDVLCIPKFQGWIVVEATANTITIDLHSGIGAGALLFDIESTTSGTMTHIPIETKSWLGCTWTNGETKNVYPTTYQKSNGSASGFVQPRAGWGISGFGLHCQKEFPSPSNVLTSYESFVATEIIALRTVLGVWARDSAHVRKNSAGHVPPSRTQYGYSDLGILTINDAPTPGQPYTLQEKNLNNSYTDVNGVTYSWTEGTGW